ncbi:MAG: GNAT family N-acetyltransferase [Bacteroidia bacterium]|nr:GNAT family N-acetyltransferase [Bacteroidia bacterium]MBP9688670.1 GNAT family N-acetyltransferase [Bacteroidia bacterium]
MSINIQPIFENEFVLLKPLLATDFELLYQVASNPQIWEQHPNKLRWQKEVFASYFEGAIKSNGAFKIIDKATGNIIGSTRFYDYKPEDNSILIGYTFYSIQYWGTGFNLMVKSMMLNHIFNYVDTVYFHIGANNIRSQLAIVKLNAIKHAEQEVTYFGEQPVLNFVYKIAKQDWLKRELLLNEYV